MGQEQGDGESTAAFIARRRREVLGRASARASAHENYGRQVRAGQALDLKQPADLVAHGASPSPGSANLSTPAAGSSPQRSISETIPEALLQVDTAIRGAANAATLGGADRFAAAANAVFTPGGLGGWKKRYDSNLQQEQARDLYDSSHRRLAQSIGSVGGDVLGLIAFASGRAAAATRLAGAAKLTAREASNLVGLGGLTGLGSQVASDLVTGRHSSMGDTAAAFAGGVAGAAAWPLGPTRAGAIDGAVAALGQDLFNGRNISIPDLARSGYGGGLIGGHLGAAGRKIADGLPISAKGRLGGLLGDARERLNGGQRMRPNKRAPVTPGQEKTNKKRSYWYPDATDGPIPDHWSEPMPKMYEDKFGYGADTSSNQKLAQANFGEGFQLNHFIPDDVAMMTGVPAAGFGPQIVNQSRRGD